MHKPLHITAIVEKSPNKGGWHYISLSDDLLSELRKQAGKNGNVPVIAKIGKTEWRSTIMSRGNQQWYLPLSSAVRQSEEIHENSKVSVGLSPDHDKLENFKKL